MPQASVTWNCGRVFSRCTMGIQRNTSPAKTRQIELAGPDSDSQTLAALGAAGIDDGAATAGLHANQKAVGAGATRLGGLVSAFHDGVLGMFSIRIALNTFRETGDYRKVSNPRQ
jgi:hypothetical protein